MQICFNKQQEALFVICNAYLFAFLLLINIIKASSNYGRNRGSDVKKYLN